MTQYIKGVSGQRLACDSIGSGPTVVLLHGGGQTRHSWRRTADALVDRGYRIVLADLRGHGESDWTERYGLDMFAADLRAVLETLAPGEAPAIVGASLGGLTAIAALGGDCSPAASALVLVDIALRNRPDGTRQIRDFMLANRDGFATVDEAADAVARYMTDRPRPKDVSGLKRNLRERDGRLFWHWDPRVMGGSQKPGAAPSLVMLEEPASRLALPVLLIRGEHSDVVDDEAIDHLRTLVPHMEAAEVRGAGHMVAGDANDPFTDAIVEFLSRHHPVRCA